MMMNYNIVLVEDDPLLVDIYTTKFEEVGFTVIVAKDGKLAFKIIKETRPHIVVLDIVLPHQDGWEVLREIREDQTFNHMKVLILSNLGQKEEVERGMRLGANKYLIKAHYTPSEVAREIARLLENDNTKE